MLKTGILNPQLLALLAHVRHTNTLVIADRGFPFWPQIETVDLSIVDDLPTVLQVLAAVRGSCVVGKAWMAKEKVNRPGEWNEMWVSAHGARLVVHVNGRQTVDFLDPKRTQVLGHELRIQQYIAGAP